MVYFFHIFIAVCWFLYLLLDFFLLRCFSLFHHCLLNHLSTMKFVEKLFLSVKVFLQFHDRGGPGSWRQPQCWENFKISLFVPSFFRSCLEVPAPAFLKQSFITFQINISLYFSHFAVFSVHFCCCSNYRAFGAPCHAGLHRVTPSHAYIVPPIRFLH